MMKTTNELSHEFDRAYSELSGLLTQAMQAEVDLLAAQVALSDARSGIILSTDTKALGANEAVREAALAQRTQAEREAVQQLEARRVILRCRVDVARLRVDHARNDLRLLELDAGTPPLPPLRIAA